jgi:hypothetical protein
MAASVLLVSLTGEPAQEANMAHFTQLGLSGSPDKKPEAKPPGKALPNISSEKQRPRSNDKKPGQGKTAVLVGSLIATALLGMFVLESGCSKESSKTTIAAPTQSVANQTLAPTMTTSATPANAVASQPPAKKKSRQRKLSAATYTNPVYGVSFRYPKSDSLKEGDEAGVELGDFGPLEMNFVQAGGTTISTVKLPPQFYVGTDFNSAFFNVGVNPKLTADECGQFAFPETSDSQTDPVAISKAKFGDTEFRAVEAIAEEENNEADVKFYHVFQNGSCYEFALGLETAKESISDETKLAAHKPAIKPVDRNEVFRQLNWILSTVKIQPTAAPQKIVPEVAADTSTPSVR